MARNFGSASRTWFAGNMKRLQRELASAMTEAVQDGKNITVQHIETRGTEKSGKAGRVDTGKMRDSVDAEVTKATSTEIEGRFGWLEEQPFYAEFQERGFVHSSGATVEPMYALSDAAEEVIDKLDKRIGQIVRGT